MGTAANAAGRRIAAIGGAVLACAALGCPGPGPAVPPTEVALEVPRLDAAAAEPAPAGVRFRRVPAAPGARSLVTTRAESRSEDPGGGEQISTYVSEVEVEVLEVEGGAPSRVALSFRTNTLGYQGEDKPTTIHGKRYVLDRAAPFVRDAQGQAVSEEEAQRVLDVFPDLGTRARVDEVLPDAPMQLGERHDELARALLRVVHPRAWTLEKGTATLSRADAERAVFSVTLAASSERGIRVDVSGEAEVRLRDSALVHLVLTGSYLEPGAAAGAGPGRFRVERTTR